MFVVESSDLLLNKYITQLKQYFSFNVVIFCLDQTVRTSGDVHIADSAIGAVAGPGAQIGTASVVTQLHPPSKDEGVFVY